MEELSQLMDADVPMRTHWLLCTTIKYWGLMRTFPHPSWYFLRPHIPSAAWNDLAFTFRMSLWSISQRKFLSVALYNIPLNHPTLFCHQPNFPSSPHPSSCPVPLTVPRRRTTNNNAFWLSNRWYSCWIQHTITAPFKQYSQLQLWIDSSHACLLSLCMPEFCSDPLVCTQETAATMRTQFTD